LKPGKYEKHPAFVGVADDGRRICKLYINKSPHFPSFRADALPKSTSNRNSSQFFHFEVEDRCEESKYPPSTLIHDLPFAIDV